MRNLKRLSAILLFFTLFSLVAIFTIHSTAFAGKCTADCGGGYSVTCEAHKCESEDGEGCSGTDKNGKKVAEGKCFQ